VGSQERKIWNVKSGAGFRPGSIRQVQFPEHTDLQSNVKHGAGPLAGCVELLATLIAVRISVKRRGRLNRKVMGFAKELNPSYR
jgi:hypothetical protein